MAKRAAVHKTDQQPADAPTDVGAEASNQALEMAQAAGYQTVDQMIDALRAKYATALSRPEAEKKAARLKAQLDDLERLTSQ